MKKKDNLGIVVLIFILATVVTMCLPLLFKLV